MRTSAMGHLESGRGGGLEAETAASLVFGLLHELGDLRRDAGRLRHGALQALVRLGDGIGLLVEHLLDVAEFVVMSSDGCAGHMVSFRVGLSVRAPTLAFPPSQRHGARSRLGWEVFPIE